MHRFLRRARIHLCQACHQRGDFIAGHQVRLTNKNLVSKSNLTARFLPIVQLGDGVLGIDQRQDGVEQVLLGDFLVHEESLRHGARVSQAGRFNDDTVKREQALALFGSQQLQRFTQILANRAADAAVVHLDDVFLRVIDQYLVVDVFLAKFVFNHSNFLAVCFGQDTFEKRGLAGTEKAGKDGDGNQAHGKTSIKRGGLRHPENTNSSGASPIGGPVGALTVHVLASPNAI